MELKFFVMIIVVLCCVHWGDAANDNVNVKTGGKAVKKRTGGVTDPAKNMSLNDWVDLGYETLKPFCSLADWRAAHLN